MGLRKLLTSIALMVALTIGVGIAVNKNDIKAIKNVEAAEASTYYYVNIDNSVWASWPTSYDQVGVKYWDGSGDHNDWQNANLSTVIINGKSYRRWTYQPCSGFLFYAHHPNANINQTIGLIPQEGGKNVYTLQENQSGDGNRVGDWSFHADETISSKTLYFDVKNWGLSSSDTVQVRFFDDLEDYEEVGDASLVKSGVYRFYSKSTTRNWKKVVIHINGEWGTKSSDLTIPTDGKDFYLLGSNSWIKQEAEFWYDYRYRCGEEDWIPLLYNDDNLDRSNYKVQFSPASSHILQKGNALYFQESSDGINWLNLTVFTYSGFNNNYDTEKNEVVITTQDTIFLKINNSGIFDCWVPGTTEYTISVNERSYYSMVGAGTSGGGKEQMRATTLVYGEKDQVLRIGNKGNYYHGYRNGDCEGIEERTVQGETNLYFTITGMYNLYLIKQDDVHWDNIYVSIDDSESAIMWAEVFMNSVSCDSSGTSLPSGWSSCVAYYANLSDATKNIIYGTSASETGTVLQQALARYDYAVRHHSSLTKFVVNSSDTPRAVSANTSSILMRINVTNNSVAAIAIIISMIGVATLGGYFFLKKSKHE